MIDINKDNQIITLNLSKDVSKFTKEEGAEIERRCIYTEYKHFVSFESLKEYMQNMDLDISKFKRFDKEEEPSRLTYTRFEDDEANEIKGDFKECWLADYDAFIEVYDWDNETDYLKKFNEVA